MEKTIKTGPEMLSSAAAVAYIKAQIGDNSKFKVRNRGFVDWKFGELAEHKGYIEAVRFIESVRRWHDYDEKYKGECLLDKTYTAFLEAEKQTKP